jgi:hypothetical protein
MEGSMDLVVWVLAGLLLALIWTAWSCGRSYFKRGRFRGIDEAVRELQAGIETQLLGQTISDDVRKALDGLRACLEAARRNRQLGKATTCSPYLRALGAALGEQCWMKGHAAGVRRKMPAEGRIRLDLSLTEQLQLVRLANLGFQYMMPNVRLIDTCRFFGEDDALNASQTISKVELAIPAEHRPDVIRQAENREAFIEDWWKPRRLQTA